MTDSNGLQWIIFHKCLVERDQIFPAILYHIARGKFSQISWFA